jgi:drug/metabolite transporter (DMT)-like permease
VCRCAGRYRFTVGIAKCTGSVSVYGPRLLRMSNPRAAGPIASMRDETRGLMLGALGVAIFALTLPMTRLAVGPASDPQLPPMFVTVGRAAGAGVLSVAYLWTTRAPWPKPAQWRLLATTALCVVIGFPLFLALALRHVESMHAAVVTGVLPIGTAVIGALVLRQRASAGFWACAVVGCLLVLAYAWQAGGALRIADGLLLIAMVSASLGYVVGARLSAQMPAQAVICWVLVLALPLTLPLALWQWPREPVSLSAWGGFAYVTLFSMWLGFFAWYRGLALGGTVRVSQVQLVQPFLSLLFAVPLLGERLDATTVAFALAVIATVFISQQMPIQTPTRSAA